MIARIGAETEKLFRDALGHGARVELDDLDQVLDSMSDKQLLDSAELCRVTTSYAVIYICGRNWPDEENRRGIAETAATYGTLAKKRGLTVQEAYDFVTRVCIRLEPPHLVFPDGHTALRVAFLTTVGILVAYRPEGKHWWEWLDGIENALEIAWAADLDLLPALMVRSRQETAEAEARAAPSQ